MIVTLSGTITHKAEGFAVIEAGGVGYQVMMNAPTLANLRTKSETKIWTHEYLREDARELYGFLTAPEHRLFRKLLAISGVGPKTAMNLLTLGTVPEIEAIIDRGEVTRLTSISGVGKKTAQKIVLELKGRLVEAGSDAGDEVISALVNLGYSREKARDALMRLPAGESSVEDRLRAALKELGR